MRYPIEFFELQAANASRVGAVAAISLEDALLNHTSCYRRIGIEDFDFNRNHPAWRQFMDRINGGQSAAAAHQLAAAAPDARETTQRFGCMGFDLRQDVVIMHFRNDGSAPEGPLSKTQIPIRRRELREMFESIFEHHQGARIVEGCSWLYNYESYRGLFPTQFTSDMEVLEDPPVRIHSTWGQFLNSTGGVHSERALAFTNAIAAATTLPALQAAFPLRTFKPRANVDAFHSFYGVPHRS